MPSIARNVVRHGNWPLESTKPTIQPVSYFPQKTRLVWLLLKIVRSNGAAVLALPCPLPVDFSIFAYFGLTGVSHSKIDSFQGEIGKEMM
jgi:hypothetical protein